MNARFTTDGGEGLERRLEALCDEVGAGVRDLVPASVLEGLLLGGGYGRGEGGVLRTDAGELPYNDLEFYVFVRGFAPLVERRYRGPLHELGERLSPAAGLEVEFKVLTLAKLRSSAASMFYYDLVAGHRWVIGDEALLKGCAHHLDAAAIPPAEATRLLMNRCSGLLYSRVRLAKPDFDAADADFVGRNLAKVQLALGDVWLAARGRYHWSCRERHARLLADAGPDAPDWLADVRRHHAEGVEFKFHPVRSREPRAALEARWNELRELARRVWLWMESRRLGRAFASTRAYAEDAGNLCPETSGWKNRLVNLRTFRGKAVFCRRAHRYPRERLFRALCLLLWEADPAADAAVVARVGGELDTAARDLRGMAGAYEKLWQRFN